MGFSVLRAKGIALADVLLGDLEVGCGRWGEAFTAYHRASRLTTRAGSGPVIALQATAYCYKMGYGCQLNPAEGHHMDAEATRRGYWKIIQNYYDGLVQRTYGIASGDRSPPAPKGLVRSVAAATGAKKDVAGTPSQQQTLTQGFGVASRGKSQGH